MKLSILFEKAKRIAVIFTDAFSDPKNPKLEEIAAPVQDFLDSLYLYLKENNLANENKKFTEQIVQIKKIKEEVASLNPEIHDDDEFDYNTEEPLKIKFILLLTSYFRIQGEYTVSSDALNKEYDNKHGNLYVKFSELIAALTEQNETKVKEGILALKVALGELIEADLAIHQDRILKKLSAKLTLLAPTVHIDEDTKKDAETIHMEQQFRRLPMSFKTTIDFFCRLEDEFQKSKFSKSTSLQTLQNKPQVWVGWALFKFLGEQTTLEATTSCEYFRALDIRYGFAFVASGVHDAATLSQMRYVHAGAMLPSATGRVDNIRTSSTVGASPLEKMQPLIHPLEKVDKERVELYILCGEHAEKLPSVRKFRDESAAAASWLTILKTYAEDILKYAKRAYDTDANKVFNTWYFEERPKIEPTRTAITDAATGVSDNVKRLDARSVDIVLQFLYPSYNNALPAQKSVDISTKSATVRPTK